jgi:hypothetical protein
LVPFARRAAQAGQHVANDGGCIAVRRLRSFGSFGNVHNAMPSSGKWYAGAPSRGATNLPFGVLRSALATSAGASAS